MRGVLVGGATAIVLLVLPATAPGTQLVAKRDPIAIALAGDRVAWTEDQGGGFALFSGSPGTTPQEMLRLPAKYRQGRKSIDLHSLNVEGSSDGVALVNADALVRCRPHCRLSRHFGELLGGPLAGPINVLSQGELVRRHSCTGDLVQPVDADLSGSVITSVESIRHCVAGKYQNGGLRLVTRSLGGGEPNVIATVPGLEDLGPGISVVQSEGRYAAWMQATGTGLHLVVYDLSSGAVRYTIGEGDAFGGLLGGFDVQADGKVALTRIRIRLSRRHSLFKANPVWYSIDDPVPHALPYPVLPIQSLLLADDRIVFPRANRGKIAKTLKGLSVTTLNGFTRPIARFNQFRQRSLGFDFDGSQVTWTQRVAGRHHPRTAILLDSVPTPLRR